MSVPERCQRLGEVLARRGIAAFFATSPVTMGYLHGLHEDGHERFLSLGVSARGEVELICPALTANQAARAGVARIAPWRDAEDPLALYRGLAGQWALEGNTVAVESEMRADMLLAMQGAVRATYVPGQAVLAELMRVKGDDELDAMRRAARIADDAYLAALPQIRAGLTERQVAAILTREMETRGGIPTFAIVATGANGAEPHHLNDDTPLQTGDVVILDFGCSVEGYQSDITRTVAIGTAPAKAQEAYAVVYAAHQAGRSAAKPGVTGEAVDAATRAVIEQAGLGEYFVHRTGHGIGMRGHEEPYIVSGNREPLRARECFSVEPGVYLPGEFGIRIENIVTLDESACVSLNDEPSPTLAVVG